LLRVTVVAQTGVLSLVPSTAPAAAGVTGPVSGALQAARSYPSTGGSPVDVYAASAPPPPPAAPESIGYHVPAGAGPPPLAYHAGIAVYLSIYSFI